MTSYAGRYLLAGSQRHPEPIAWPYPKGHMMHQDDRVQFERPDLRKLNNYHTVVDLHFHSQYSDGLNQIHKIADKARRLNIGIAITDHNEIRGALAIDKHKDLLTIPGIEITSAEGSHLLAYFYDTQELKRFYARDVQPFMGQGVMSSLSLGMQEIIQRAKQYECLIIFAHPYCALYTGICNLHFSQEELNRMFRWVDGVEVINSSNLHKWNLKCAVLGFNLGKAMTGGSDGHALNHMGRAVTYADCKKERGAFLDAVRNHHNQVAGKEITLLRKFTSNGMRLRCNLNNCPDLVEKHIRYSCKVINFKSKAIRTNVRRKFNEKLNTKRLKGYFDI